jgi:3-oxoacyl-[acyl-carrier protein] reductase
MSDFLLENEGARRIIQALGLPIPLPQRLSRTSGPWEERPLADQKVLLGGEPSELSPAVARTLTAAGAETYVVSDATRAAFAEPGEAFGRPARPLDPGALGDEFCGDALVFDATSMREPSRLRALYEFFHPLMRRLARSGRVVLFGRPAGLARGPEEAAAQAALEGFSRSLAKEIGKRGATANLIAVEPGAEARAEGVLRFLLSQRSAFVTAQVVRVSAQVPVAGDPIWVRPLEGKAALVTGAARGIGAATARRLAAEGAQVVCLDRPSDDGPLSQIAREIGGTVLTLDVTDAGAPAAIRDALVERHRGVDIVVHNAGITRDKTLARMEAGQWDQAVDVNLVAVSRITRALLDGALRDRGRIICLSSVAGIAGNLGQTNYAASKAGLIGLCAKLAAALAERGITVNAVAPGFIETRLTAAIPVVIREVGRRLSALGQGGLPEDVAEAITFLASPGAAGITGGVLRVCGGAFIGA